MSEALPMPPTLPAETTRWRVADAIDLEVLLAADRRAEPEAVRRRDRAIHGKIKEAESDSVPDREVYLQRWLEARKKELFGSRKSPGERTAEVLWWVGGALLILGLLIGRGAVWAFLHGLENTAGQPVNAPGFLLVCVALPFALALYGFWVLFSTRVFPALPAPPLPLRGLLLRVIQPLLGRAAGGKWDETRADDLRLVLNQSLAARSNAVALKILSLIQLFGLGFSTGVLASYVWDVTVESHVFSWSNTFGNITAERLHAFLRGAATPWAWFAGEGRGYPTLEQVRATQFFRFQNPQQIPAKSAQPWSAFLLGAVIVYGLLPRVILYGLTARRLHKALQAGFGTVRFDAIWHRMITPQGQWQPAAGESGATRTSGSPAALEADSAAKPSCVVVLPQELQAREGLAAALEKSLTERRGWRCEALLTLPTEPAGRQTLLEGLGRLSQPPDRLMIVQESFMPPSLEATALLDDLRTAVGPETGLLIALLGLPDENNPLGRAPRPEHFRMWERSGLRRADPNLQTTSFLEPR